jgi:hypothetical protein
MKILRFIFPFLFARNWYNGNWEFSWQRFTLFAGTLGFIILGLIIAFMLQTPVTYNASL